MDKIVSYAEFLKNKNNIRKYLEEIFEKLPDITIYFPNNLDRDERHLIYTNSKGYLFEKLHKVGSKYSLKLWLNKEDEPKIEDDFEDEEVKKIEEEEEEDDEVESSEYEDELELKLDYIKYKIDKLEFKLNDIKKVMNMLKFIDVLLIINIGAWISLMWFDPVRMIIDCNETNQCF